MRKDAGGRRHAYSSCVGRRGMKRSRGRFGVENCEYHTGSYHTGRHLEQSGWRTSSPPHSSNQSRHPEGWRWGTEC